MHCKVVGGYGVFSTYPGTKTSGTANLAMESGKNNCLTNRLTNRLTSCRTNYLTTAFASQSKQIRKTATRPATTTAAKALQSDVADCAQTAQSTINTQRGCSSVDRVLASEAKGRGFDPRQPRHPFTNQPGEPRNAFAKPRQPESDAGFVFALHKTCLRHADAAQTKMAHCIALHCVAVVGNGGHAYWINQIVDNEKITIIRAIIMNSEKLLHHIA